MNRATLDSMSTDQLLEEARRLSIPAIETRRNSHLRERLIDALMSHMETNAPIIETLRSDPPIRSTAVTEESTGSKDARAEFQRSSDRQVSVESTSASLNAMLTRFCESMTTQMSQNQRTLEQLIVAVNRNVSAESSSTHSTSSALPATIDRSNVDREIPRSSAFSMVSSAQAVNLLASQIPMFGGQEEEDVLQWTQRIERVAQIYQVTEDVVLLAASSKLAEIAKRWFDLGSGIMIESWQRFREAIIRCFSRRIPFPVVMQKMEARRWNFPKETFQEYAMEKLALMHTLQLSEQDSIHLLINGIESLSLRSTAISLKAETIDQFLQDIYRVAAVSACSDRRGENSSDKTGKPRDIPCKTCGKKGHPHSV